MVAARMAPIRPPPSVRPMPSPGNSALVDQRADNADENVAQEAEPSSLHQKSGEPAGDGTNDQRYKQSCQHDFPHVKELTHPFSTSLKASSS